MFFGWDKCFFWPEQLLPWLGLLLSSNPVLWIVPEDKMQRLRCQLQRIVSEQQLSSRELASMAGLLEAVRDALPHMRCFEHANRMKHRSRM